MLLLFIISFGTSFVCSYIVFRELREKKRKREMIAIANLPLKRLVAHAITDFAYLLQYQYLLKATTEDEANIIIARRYLYGKGLISYRRRGDLSGSLPFSEI